MSKTVIIVPCYNEEQRLDVMAFAPFLAGSEIHLLFIDDGSTDGTYTKLLQAHQLKRDQVDVLRLTPNQGKAEAVRRGLLQALEQGCDVVGYFDADLSTPAEEMCRLVEVLRESSTSVVLGARVRLLGYSIVRNPARHYLGRVFGTFASLALGLSVYDTQCGAKLFRDTPALRSALQRPFLSRWAFDVELIGRLMSPPAGVAALSAADFLEVPLRAWTHVPGSKLKAASMVRAALDLAAIAIRQGHRH